MNNGDLEYYLTNLYKERLKLGSHWLEARKNAKIIIEMFGGGIIDELFSQQKEIMNKLEWDYR